MPVTSGVFSSTADLRCELAVAVDATIHAREWTQTLAADKLDTNQPSISAIHRTAVRRSQFPTETPVVRRVGTRQLLDLHTRCGGRVVAAFIGHGNVTLPSPAHTLHERLLARIGQWSYDFSLAEAAERLGTRKQVVSDARALRVHRVRLDTACDLAVAAGIVHSLMAVWPPGVKPYLPNHPPLQVTNVRPGTRQSCNHYTITDTRKPNSRVFYTATEVDGNVLVHTREPGQQLLEPQSPRALDINDAITHAKMYKF